MLTRPSQDFIEAERKRRTTRKAALAVIERSPGLARTARKFVVKMVWPNHQCYGEFCSYCHHQDEVIAAMVLVARSHARRALRGHVFDNEIEAALRAAEAEPKRKAKAVRK